MARRSRASAGQTPWAFDARELWPRGVVRPAMLSVYPNSAPRMPMTLRKMMIPTMTTVIKREDQEPKATAVTLSHYDHLWRWWGCLADGESLSASVNRSSRGSAFRGRLVCDSILADRDPGENAASVFSY